MKVKILANTLKAMLWIGLLAFTAIWIFKIDFPYEPEPITVLLGFAVAAITTLSSRYENAIRAEKYSVANVLAQGYVINFVEPVVNQLLKDRPGQKIRFYIFVPSLLSELTPKSIDRWKLKMLSQGLKSDTEKVELSEGRGLRDVMTISKSDSKNIFFDFPNTLYSLTNFVDYKLDSPKDSLDLVEKNRLGGEYIKKFKEQLIHDLTELHLYPDVVKLTDCDLKIDL